MGLAEGTSILQESFASGVQIRLLDARPEVTGLRLGVWAFWLPSFSHIYCCLPDLFLYQGAAACLFCGLISYNVSERLIFRFFLDGR